MPLLLLAALLLAGASPTDGFAQTTAPDLARASIEDLLNIEITSASRKEQRLSDAPAAVYVITQDDIRRSGMTTVPDLLRLAPGIEVARVNSSEWAVSIRGFNNLVANKLLVLVDGRTIYNRAYTGVVWSSDEMVIDDIDRIEVIRGPGGAVWGANAVNGVINIITKSSAATQGAFVRAGGGTLDDRSVAARYGGTIAGATYRVYSQLSDHADSFLTPDARTGDHWHSVSSGGRLDWRRGTETYMLEGSYIDARTLPYSPSAVPNAPQQGSNVATGSDHTSLLGLWTHAYDGGASLHVQSFLNVNHQQIGVGATSDSEKIGDLDVVYTALVAKRHNLVGGGGYRYATDYIPPTAAFSLDPATSTGSIANIFAQDEIALSPQFSLTLGSKFEHDSLSGWDVQPTAKALWKIGPSGQRLWAATSRADRTPAPLDVAFRLRTPLPPAPDGTPLMLGIFGNPTYQDERLTDLEVGYGLSLGRQAVIELAGFKGHYDGLATLHALTPTFESTPAPAHVLVPLQFANGLDANTTGLEIDGRWNPFANVSLTGSYSYLRIVSHLTSEATGDEPASQSSEDLSPTDQWQVHASTPLGARAEISGSLFHVGRIDAQAIPAYTRADVRLAFTLTRQLSIVGIGQNMLQATHVEGTGASKGQTSTLIPRSASISLEWRPR